MKHPMKGRAKVIQSLAESMSDNELRDALYGALRAVEPGLDWIADVFPDEKMLVYTCIPGDELLWYRRTYAMGEGGAVTLNDDRQQVEPTTEYKPVAEVAQAKGQAELPLEAPAELAAAPRAACGCKNKLTTRASREGATMTKKELVDRLIALSAAPFDETDRPALEVLTEAKLEGLLAKLDAAPTEEPEPVEPEPAPALTEDQQIAALPESLRAMIARDKATQASLRANLAASIGRATTVYTPAQLAAKTTEDLQLLAQALKVDQPVADYSGRAVALAETTVTEPPKPYALALARRKAAAEAAN